jgi:two-component system cell cycle sensor histidine kinase/response regulator CckA
MDQESKGSVLLVEDDDQVRTFIRMLLTNNGYRVLEAQTGAEGLAIAESESGFDLAQKTLELKPEMKILFMTGYVEGDIVQRCISELGASFLDKPFQPNTLLSRVQEAISSARN